MGEWTRLPSPVEAVFLDRDGVINRERADYVKCWDEFEFLPGVLPALARLADLPQPVIVVTNQSAVGRGLMGRSALDEIHRRLQHRVAASGGRIDAFYLCPHRPDEGCACRKPQPGLLLQAAQDFGLNLSNCVFIGDSITDREAAQAAGCACCLVASGRQGEYLAVLAAQQQDLVLKADLDAAITWLLAQTAAPG
jgi:D-glycero-D-manno-heptose 1,7-bisphosphate phosphatase